MHMVVRVSSCILGHIVLCMPHLCRFRYSIVVVVSISIVVVRILSAFTDVFNVLWRLLRSINASTYGFF